MLSTNSKLPGQFIFKMNINLVVALTIMGSISISDAFYSGKVLPPQVENLAGVSQYYISQILDHSNTTSTSFWNQRFFINDQYWGGGNSPVFLMIGGEDAISPSFMVSGMWVLWAQKYNALLLQLEHRFYGLSHPVAEPTPDNLIKYLSSDQALADVAYFIQTINGQLSLTYNNKWIVFGGSYPGALAAWARLKYPQFIHGAIASSAPVQTFFDFYQYNIVVKNTLNFFYPGCADQVTKAMKKVQSLLQSNQGVKTLNTKIPICPGFNQSIRNDVTVLTFSLTSPIATAVQYNKQSQSNGVDLVCQYMNNQAVADPLDRLAQYLKSQSSNCAFGSYQQAVAAYRQNPWNDYRHWFFQLCNELGYFQTSENTSSYLSDLIPVQYFVDFCADSFSPHFTYNQIMNNVDASSRYYGGLDIDADRVVLIHGTGDPWYPLGLINHPTDQEPLILINRTSHCYDMLSPRPDDSASLREARNTADKYIQQWLTSQ